MSKDKNRPKTIRCVIYTGKSTDDGLEQEYNSIAQSASRNRPFQSKARR